MALNIKHAEADDLVAELVALTGESKTRAVVVALRERLEREKQRRRQNALSVELMEIGRRCVAYGRRDQAPHGDLLYDDKGLPRP